MIDEFVQDSDDIKLVCDDRDWNCLWNNFYKGYLIIVEVIFEDNDDYRLSGVDVTGLSNEDIENVIKKFKKLYPDAVAYRVHFCGNHLGKPCAFIGV